MQAITTFLAILQIIRQLFPEIIAIVQTVEAAFPAGGQGAAKLDMVRGILQSSYAGINGASVTFEQVWPAVQGVIASVVKMTKPAAPAPVAAA